MAVTVIGSNGAIVTIGASGATYSALLTTVADVIDQAFFAGSHVTAIGSSIPAAPGTSNDAVVVSVGGAVTVPSGYKTILYQGGAGTLTIQAAAGLDVASGSGGITYFGAADPNGNGGIASVAAGGGNNLVAYGTGSKYTTALGDGSDTVYANGSGVSDVGGGTNLVFVSGGANTVFASGTADTIVAGTGTATIGSSGSKATIFTGSGPTFVAASGIGDTIVGGAGLSTIFAGDQSVTFFNNAAFTVYTAPTNGAATVVGGTNPGIVFGTAGSNVTYFNTPGGAQGVLIAGAGSETLNASGTNVTNVLYSGTGADVLRGGTADDVIVGATGTGTLTGGGGKDLFTFIRGGAGGSYVVTDFTTGTDAVVLSGYGKAEVSNALAGASTTGGATAISLSDGTRISFSNVGSLTTSAFLTNNTIG